MSDDLLRLMREAATRIERAARGTRPSWYMQRSMFDRFVVATRRLPWWCRWIPRRVWPHRLLDAALWRLGKPTHPRDHGRRRR